MKKIVFIFLILSSLTIEAQIIDSVKIYPNNPVSNDTIYAQLFCTRLNTMDHISRLTVSVIDDTVEVNTYWKLCGGYAVITNFDTIVKINPLNLGNYNFKFITCLDTNSANNFCLQRNEVDCYDTINKILNVLQTVEEISDKPIINIQPNPFEEYVQISFAQHYRSGHIDLIDLYGRSIKTVYFNNNTEITLYRNDLPSGVYFLKVSFDGNHSFVKKLVIK